MSGGVRVRRACAGSVSVVEVKMGLDERWEKRKRRKVGLDRRLGREKKVGRERKARGTW